MRNRNPDHRQHLNLPLPPRSKAKVRGSAGEGQGWPTHTPSTTPSPPGSFCELWVQSGVHANYRVPVLRLFKHIPAQEREEGKEGPGAPVQLYHLHLDQPATLVNCAKPEFPQMVIMRIKRGIRIAWYRACPQKSLTSVLSHDPSPGAQTASTTCQAKSAS